MRTALIFLAVGILLLLVLYSLVDVWFMPSSVDIHVHDTYFVIANIHVVPLMAIFLGNFFILGGVIGTRFRNKFFFIGLAILILADAYIVWTFYPALKNLA